MLLRVLLVLIQQCMRGLATRGLMPDKSNWAQPLDSPPFRAYPVTGGITFTFGGLRVDQNAQVLEK
ncbi:MAG: hypothetical protein CM1200mP20_00300 [Pseudomonadota bacterium]|nr:MAG: hypothetical protein CM1200mP20_00300 [Pseudomonadota bacterium]